jgi:hypothetical protein
MRRRFRLPALCFALLAFTTTAAASASAATGTSSVNCAQTEKTTIPSSSSPAPSPSESPSCWEEIQPYPFGADGQAIGVENAQTTPECEPGADSGCYLTVTSMAFRAWNRGLAATAQVFGAQTNAIPYGVWIFDGKSWAPDHSFPGTKECPGNTIVWAGKLDYWLVGPGNDNWPAICRYEGFKEKAWQKLALPAATLSDVTGRPGGITSASCFAWNNCWFFGTYGVVVHWNGEALEGASPPSSEPWLHGEYTGAVARENLAGEPFGVAVGADEERWQIPASTEKLPEHGGAPAPQMYGSHGDVFSPLLFSQPLFAQPPGDPFGTDLVAADFDALEQGWVVGNPAWLRLREREAEDPPTSGDPAYASPAVSPLEPVSASGASTGCKAPAPNFEYQTIGAPDPKGSFLWSSVSVVPSSGEALAGGNMRKENPQFGEPVIAQVNCDGAATLTRFRIPEAQSNSQPAPLVPADLGGGVTAIAANATNDAWAATSIGALSPHQPPRLYRLSNGKPPEAPEGNNEESRPLELEEDKPVYEEEPAPVETAASTASQETVPPPPPVTLPPAIYDVKVKLHKVKRHRRIYLSLYLTFKVQRPIELGAQALRRGRVVSTARPRLFSGQTGQLILSVERKRWPTNIRFIS